LDPILADWDNVYRAKKDEAAWVHVNALIEKARQIRRQMPAAQFQSQESAQTQPASTNVQGPAVHQNYNPNSSTGQTPGSSVIGLVPDAAWQSEWGPSNGFGMSPETIVPQYQQGNESTPTQQPYQIFPTPAASNSSVPFLTGCAPAMDGLDVADFGYIEGLDNIDFSAFDAVFKDMASSPGHNPYVNMLCHVSRNMRHKLTYTQRWNRHGTFRVLRQTRMWKLSIRSHCIADLISLHLLPFSRGHENLRGKRHQQKPSGLTRFFRISPAYQYRGPRHLLELAQSSGPLIQMCS
jgi:hypothetical protein